MTDSQTNPSASQDEVMMPQGLGSSLRALREAKQLTLNEVSMRLKFSARQIEALENEQWKRLPKGMSLRGMVKNYARYLDTDANALLAMLDAQVDESTVVTPRKMPSEGLGPAELNTEDALPRRPWGWLLVILVLVFVAIFYAIDRGWIPDSWLVFDWLKSLKN